MAKNKGNAHQQSRDMQAVFRRRGIKTKNHVLEKMFPGATDTRIKYARDVVKSELNEAEQSASGAVMTNVLVPPMSNPTDCPNGQPHVIGPLVKTERVLDGMMAIAEELTGEDVMFSTADVIMLMQLSNDEAVGLLRKCGLALSEEQQ